MVSPLDDLACSGCPGYLHPFLDACPGCGTSRASRYDDAIAGHDLGYRALLRDPRVIRLVRQMVMRYTLKSLGGEEDDQVREGLDTVLGSLPYAVSIVGALTGSSSQAQLALGPDELLVHELHPSREVARIPLASILAVRARGDGRDAGAWAGLAALGRRDLEHLPAVDGDLVLTFAAEAGPARLALANRRGITVAKARSDHYVFVAKELAICAAAAAEARWTEVGAARYAAELGFAPVPVEAAPPSLAGSSTSPASAPSAGAAAVTPAVQPAGTPDGDPIATALATLDELRARRLVTDAEYAEKRREILARL